MLSLVTPDVGERRGGGDDQRSREGGQSCTWQDISAVQRCGDKFQFRIWIFIFSKDEEDVHRSHFGDLVIGAEEPQHLKAVR
jgi:hypothetical protein